MIFLNSTIIYVIIFLILLFISSFLLYFIYKRNKTGKLKLLFLFLGFLFLLISIFDIRGGFIKGIDTIKGGKVVFVVDVSKSMNVKDIGTRKSKVSRLQITKEFIKNFIINNLKNRYGLLIFGGETLEVIPFTENIEVFSTILYGINDKNISKYGTNFNSVFTSLENYFIGKNDGGLVVIFSDGGDEEIDLDKNLLTGLEKKGVKIILIGVGTKSGGKISIGTDFFGSTIYKTYMGEEVLSSINYKEFNKLSNNYNIEYRQIDNLNDFKSIESLIKKNINIIDLKKSNNNRINLTRLFIFISFVFFTLFVLFEHFGGIRKK